MQELHKKINALGPKISVITDGPNGSMAYDGKDFYELGLYETPIVDRTGVGDSFATAFICALFHDKSVEEAMKWGTINAGGVISKIGPQEGLMKKEEIEKILQANPNFTKPNLS